MSEHGRLNVLKARLKQAQQELRTLKEKERRNSLRQARFGLGPRALHTSLAAYVLSGYRSDVAGRLAKKLARRATGGEELDWSRVVEDLFLKMEDPVLQSILGPVKDEDVRSVQRAREFLAQDALVDRVCEQNLQHGVAPSSFDVACEYSQMSEQFLDLEEQWPQNAIVRKSTRRWVQKWGRKWDVKRGKLEYQEDIPHGELMQKAPRISAESSLCQC